MFAEKYKKANDSICISDVRREELLSIIRNESTERERKRNLHIAKLLIAGFVIIFVTCCSMVITDKIRTVKVDESTNEDSSFQNEMFFNKIPLLSNEINSDVQFNVAGEGEYKRSELPSFLSDVLPVFPENYAKTEELFDAYYSKNWNEFYINTTTKLGDKSVSVYAERKGKTADVIPQNWVSCDLDNLKYDVYFAADSKNVFSANYIADDGILIGITTDELERSEFVELIKKCLKAS